MKVRLPVRPAILKRRTYEAPAEGRLGKIRLDFNENTRGCSKAVLRALARLTAPQIAMYPEYQTSSLRLAKYFGVRSEELLLRRHQVANFQNGGGAFQSGGAAVLFSVRKHLG